MTAQSNYGKSRQEVLSFVKCQSGVFTAQDVQLAVKGIKKKEATNIIYKLLINGDIIKVSRGRYSSNAVPPQECLKDVTSTTSNNGHVKTLSDVADLIKWQKAEILRLEAENQELERCINTYRVEIYKLKKAVED